MRFSFIFHLFHKRKIEKKKGKKSEKETFDDSILQIIKGMNYCYLIDNKPNGNSIVMNESSIISQVEWKDGKVDGEVIIGDYKKKQLIFVGNVKDQQVISSTDLSSIHIDTIDLSDDGCRWEGQVLNNQPFGWGCYYDNENYLRYEGFCVHHNSVCYGTIYHELMTNNCILYKGTICNSMKWGYGQLFDRCSNCIYEGSFLQDSMDNDKLIIKPKSQSLLGFHSLIQELTIGEGCCSSLLSFNIDNHQFLRKIIIKSHCYSEKHDQDSWFNLKNLPSLEEVIIESYSFEYFNHFTMKNLPHLQLLQIGSLQTPSYCFKYCLELSLMDLPLLKDLILSDYVFSHLESAIIENCSCLQTIQLGERALNGLKSSASKSMVGLLSVFNNTSLILKDLPSLISLQSTGYQNFNNFGLLTIQNIPLLKNLQLNDCFHDIGSLNIFNAESFKGFVGKNNGYGILNV